MAYKFIRWGEGRRYAIFQNTETGEYVAVPFSRIIPHPLCESKYRSLGYTDPNEIAAKCAEEDSIFGLAIFRHELHLSLAYRNTLVREREKEYFFPRTIDFACVRECISKGEDTEKCIRKCS